MPRLIATDRSTLRMAQNADDSQPPFPMPSLNQGLLGVGALMGASGLATSVPRLVAAASRGGPADALASVVIDAIVFFIASSGLLRSLQKVDYAALPGLEQASLALEAGEWALAGEVPTRSKDGAYEVATFAGGCFWGTELHFQRISGVVATCVGYTQGRLAEPKYDQVCSGTTGHTEGIQLIYDPAVVSYERLVEKLLSTVDPTLKNRVGNDRGTQYRHGIYPHTDEQAEVAARCLERLSARCEGPVLTELRPAALFWPAEDYHQRYLERKGQSAAKECEEKVRCYG